MSKRTSRRLLFSTTVAIALAGCGNGPGDLAHSHPVLAVVPIAIKATDADVFDPVSARAKVGDVIEWTNFGAHPHNITVDNYPTLDGDLASGTNWQAKFTKAGIYSYRCTIHPKMTALITVG